MLIIAQGLKEKWFENDGFCSFKQQTNLWMKLPTISPGLADKIVKYRPLSEPIRSQDLEDSARSQAWKKNKEYYFNENFTNVRKTWEGINSLLKRKKNKNKTINTVNSEEEERNIQNIPAAELQQLAKKFVLGVKKENGEEYETSSLRRFLQSVKKDAHFLFWTTKNSVRFKISWKRSRNNLRP